MLSQESEGQAQESEGQVCHSAFSTLPAEATMNGKMAGLTPRDTVL